MEFVELTEKEFQRLKFGCRSFLQSVEMFHRYKKLGWEAYVVGVKESGKILAAGLMSSQNWRFGKKIFRVPGGWLLDYDATNDVEANERGNVTAEKKSAQKVSKTRTPEEILEFLTAGAKDFCKARGGMAIEISPNIISEPRDIHNNVVPGPNHLAVKAALRRMGYKYLGERNQAKWIFTLNLEGKTADEIYWNLRTTTRQLIHKAEKTGVRVRELGLDELNILKGIVAQAGERYGFKDPEMTYYRSMKEAFGEKVKFMLAEAPRSLIEGKQTKDTAGGMQNKAQTKGVARNAQGQADEDYIPLAASMFVNDAQEMVYLYSGSIKVLQKYNGVYAIQWAMIKEAIEAGSKKYNFYGVRPVEGNGVYKFKQGFHGVVEELLGTFVLPIGAIGKIYTAFLKEQTYGDVH